MPVSDRSWHMAMQYLSFRRLRRHGAENDQRHAGRHFRKSVHKPRLAPKWMFPVPGVARGLEVTPVVVDGVMYVTAANEAYALDARNGRQIWHYSRPRTPRLVGDAASGINRGAAVLGDRVFMVTDNARLIALHRLTGQLLWDVALPRQPELVQRGHWRTAVGPGTALAVRGELLVAELDDQGVAAIPRGGKF